MAAEIKILRSIEGIIILDKVKNSEIRTNFGGGIDSQQNKGMSTRLVSTYLRTKHN